MGSYTLFPSVDIVKTGVGFPTITKHWNLVDDPTLFDDDETYIRYFFSLGKNVFNFPSTIVPSNEPITRVQLQWRYKGTQDTRSSARGGFIIGSTSLWADVRTINAFTGYTTYLEQFLRLQNDFWTKSLVEQSFMAHEYTSFDTPEITHPRLTGIRMIVSTGSSTPTEVTSVDGIVTSTLKGTVFVQNRYDSTIRHRIVNHTAAHLIRSDDTLFTEVGSPFFLPPTHGNKVTKVGTPYYHSVIRSNRSGKWITSHQKWLLDSSIGTANLRLSDIIVADPLF